MPRSSRGCGGISPARVGSSNLTSPGLSYLPFYLQCASASGPLEPGQSAQAKIAPLRFGVPERPRAFGVAGSDSIPKTFP
jgi:hypothetical protein